MMGGDVSKVHAINERMANILSLYVEEDKREEFIKNLIKDGEKANKNKEDQIKREEQKAQLRKEKVKEKFKSFHKPKGRVLSTTA